MPISFPTNPADNDTHVIGSITYQYNATDDKWTGLGISPSDRLIEGNNKLEIDGSNNLIWTGGPVIVSSTGTFSPYVADTNFQITDDTNPKLVLNNPGNSTYSIAVGTDSQLSFRNESQARTDMVIDYATGRVGIGEDSPADRLVVQKENASGDVGVRIKNDTLTDGDATNPTTASLYLNTSTGDFNTFYIQARRSDNNTHFGYADPRSANHTPNLVITSDGNVGINQTSPTSQSGKVLHISGDNGGQARIHLSTSASGHADDEGHYICSQGAESGAVAGQLAFINMENRNITFNTGTSGANATRLTIQHDGNLNIADGNLVVASGHGINFHNYGAGNDVESNLLDDYEEGTWSPQIKGWNGSYAISEGGYIKIGRQVFISGEVLTDASTGSGADTWPGLSNLPFVNTTAFHPVGGSQRNMGSATILGDISPSNSGMAFVTFDRYDGFSFFPNHITPSGANNFQNTMINNISSTSFGYRFNCTYFTD